MTNPMFWKFIDSIMNNGFPKSDDNDVNEYHDEITDMLFDLYSYWAKGDWKE